MNYPQFKVTVSCMTYNQSKYITDAMNGFTMQQTSFPFVCTIVDDASTDGEQEVIRKYVEDHFDFSEGSVAYHKETDYAHITYAQHKTNKNCYFAVLYLKENHYSQHKDKSPYLKEWREGVDYMALCEGDDYWIDSLKLKKQVDFLDVNFDYSMCFHNAEIYNLCNSKLKFKIVENRDYSLKELYDDWIVPTASVIYRKGCESGVIKGDDRIINGDINLIMALSSNGRVRGMQESMSVYRLHNNGLTMSRSIEDNEMLQRKYIKHYKCLQEHYSQIPKNSFNRKMADVYINLGIELCKKYKISLFYYLLLALAYSPFRFMERIGNLFNQK